jgi:hypothetical protein
MYNFWSCDTNGKLIAGSTAASCLNGPTQYEQKTQNAVKDLGFFALWQDGHFYFWPSSPPEWTSSQIKNVKKGYDF